MLKQGAARLIERWQWTLLPLMSIILISSALFFAFEAVYQFSDLKGRILLPHSDLSPIFEKFEAQPENSLETHQLAYLQWKSTMLLEQEAVQQRYSNVGITILARLWTRLMGFTTGMILAIIGAVFILGKMRELPSEVRQETSLLKLSIRSTSPGIILATLGALLMGISLVVRFDVEMRDVPIYLNSKPLPPALPDPSSMMQRRSQVGQPSNERQIDPLQGGTP